MPHVEFVGPDGDTWPSVTQIISVIAKPQLMAWYAKVGTEEVKRVLDSTGDIGTQVHDEIFRRFSNTQPTTSISNDASEMVSSFWESFVEPFKVTHIELEKKVVNTEHRYHGTFDGLIECTGLIKGIGYQKGPILVDWKTSSGIYDTMGIQLGGYWLATPNAPKDGLIVRIGKKKNKKGKYSIQLKGFKDLQHYANLFLNARALWDYVNHKGAWEKPK